MTKTTKNANRGVTRRNVLKGGAAAAGLAAGSGVITGFPTIWAQNIKDVTLNHTGMSYSTLIDIARQASTDLGFKVEMSVVDHPGLTNRMVNDPKSIDIADSEIWQTKVYVPLGVTQAVDVKKIKLWDKLTPLYTEGTFAGKEVSRQGDSPYRDHVSRSNRRAPTFQTARRDWATFMPGVYNADTLGIRPDLVGRDDHQVGRPVSSATSRARPRSRTSRPIGIMDAIMALRVGRPRQVRRQGQPDPGRARPDHRAS